jgi:uncharacterized protein (DUF1778 family)
MARPPDGKTARTEWLKLRVTPEDLAAIDHARGGEDRSSFVRQAVAEKIERQAASR